MQNILFIVGSLRRESYNRQLAKQAENLLQGKAHVSYLEFADMPYMNQDIEFPAPAVVQRVRFENMPVVLNVIGNCCKWYQRNAVPITFLPLDFP